MLCKLPYNLSVKRFCNSEGNTLQLFKRLPSIKMIVKIWRGLAQILYYRNDLIEIIKPFFENSGWI